MFKFEKLLFLWLCGCFCQGSNFEPKFAMLLFLLFELEQKFVSNEQIDISPFLCYIFQSIHFVYVFSGSKAKNLKFYTYNFIYNVRSENT